MKVFGFVVALLLFACTLVIAEPAFADKQGMLNAIDNWNNTLAITGGKGYVTVYKNGTYIGQQDKDVWYAMDNDYVMSDSVSVAQRYKLIDVELGFCTNNGGTPSVGMTYPPKCYFK